MGGGRGVRIRARGALLGRNGVGVIGRKVRDMVRDVAGSGDCVRYANIRIRVIKERQLADVRRWKGQACEILVCAGGVYDSGEAAFFAGVVLVQLGLCAKMIDEVLQLVRGGRPRVVVGGDQFIREGKL